MSDAFRTFQTVRRYEEALARHAQWIRWTQVIKCPCVNPDTMTPDARCPICSGRGRIYKTPDSFVILDEIAKKDGSGRIYPKYTPVVSGSVRAYRQGSLIALSATQPADGSYIQLEPPYPKSHQLVTISYSFDSGVNVTNENSEVYGTNLLRTVATRFDDRGKSFEGSIELVSRVYNVTRDESYTVIDYKKEYIWLESMGAYQSGDTLEVDYVYVKPFNFMLTGVTGKIRYEQPYIMEDADAVLVTPYWAHVSPDDLFTAMAQEQIGTVIIDPTVNPGGNDEIISHFDLARLLRVIDKQGVEHAVGVGNDVEIYGRNELKWNVSKPNIPYTVQFTYHPTYTALPNMHTLRNSENKAFVNRVSVKMFDRLHEQVNY
jgi:hypothetical protein